MMILPDDWPEEGQASRSAALLHAARVLSRLVRRSACVPDPGRSLTTRASMERVRIGFGMSCSLVDWLIYILYTIHRTLYRATGHDLRLPGGDAQDSLLRRAKNDKPDTVLVGVDDHQPVVFQL